MTSEEFYGYSLLLVSLVCLGTWPAILRLCSTDCHAGMISWKSQPRDNRFAYMDYALAYVLSSSIPLAITAFNDGEEFGTASWVLVIVAMIGGSLLSLGNISLQWSTTVFGAPLTTVVAVQASLTVTLGTSINYFLEPEMTAKPAFLFFGVLVFLVAIVLASKAHLLYGEQKEQKLRGYSEIELKSDSVNINYQSTETGTNVPVNDDEQIKMENPTTLPKTALYVAIFGGVCFGFFSPAFNVAVNDPFGIGDGDVLPVTVANIWFSLAFALASFLGNLILMYKPPLNSGLERMGIKDYMHESFSERHLAISAGMICGIANLLQFKGGSMVGFATADLVQAYPLVSTFWDIFLFGEFSKAGKNIICCILSMYMMYLSGIVLIILSSIH